jgi:hypothetical protein
MTCIAAIATRSEVWMGADSCGANGWSYMIRRDPKLFRTGPFLLGFTSSFRMGQLLRFGAEAEKLSALAPSGDPFAFMVEKFIPSVRKILKAGGFMTTKDGVESGGSFLVAFGRHLFEIDPDFQVAQDRRGLHSIGSGYTFALGAMALARGEPRARILQALRIVTQFQHHVRGPFQVLSTRGAA